MAPRGAIPEAEYARLDSDVHHLREQADIDRRTTAARHQEERLARDRFDQQLSATAAKLGRVEDLVNRLDVANTANAQTLTKILTELAERRGGHKTMGALAVLASVISPIVFEILRHFFK
jgi:hypothetical protein